MSDQPDSAGLPHESLRPLLRLGGHEFVVFSTPSPDSSRLEALTEAEREVAALLLDGLSDDEIARRRGTSIHTVRSQLAAIYDKFDVQGRYELVAELVE